MHGLSPENCDSDILVTGMTINDFINEKIKELGSEVSIKDNNMFKFYYESVTPWEYFEVAEIIEIHMKKNQQQLLFFFQDREEPFLVANLDNIFKRHLRWLSSLSRVKPFYAVKCNNTPAVLRMLSALDTGFDCASKVRLCI